MRILLTNRSLDQRAGSELYLFELATRLLARGHAPVAFSPRLGKVAARIYREVIRFRDHMAPLAEGLGHRAARGDLIACASS